MAEPDRHRWRRSGGWRWRWDRSWDWSGWSWTGGGWQQEQRAGAQAGSAGDDATTPWQLYDEKLQRERRKLGITGRWSEWDAYAASRLVANLPEAASDAAESAGQVSRSRRHTQLGKAFQNYRRHTLDKLAKKRTEDGPRVQDLAVGSFASKGRSGPAGGFAPRPLLE